MVLFVFLSFHRKCAKAFFCIFFGFTVGLWFTVNNPGSIGAPVIIADAVCIICYLCSFSTHY